MSPDTLLARGRRYVSVGVVCAVVHNLVVIGADLAGLHYLPATLLSFLIVTPLGYLLHCHHSFRKKPSRQGFLRFTAGIAVGYPLSLGLMVLLCSGLGLPVVVATPLATAALFVWNYASAHWAIVRRLRIH